MLISKTKKSWSWQCIETATAIFDREVLQSAMKAQEGTERLRAVVNSFLSHLEHKVFPGACFVASVAAELGENISTQLFRHDSKLSRLDCTTEEKGTQPGCR